MKNNPGAAFIFPAHPHHIRNSDVHYPFRQDSNLHYLTGFDEADSILVLCPSSRPGEGRMVMFVLPRDPEREMWEGERYGIEGAQKVFGAHEAYPIQEFDKKLPELLSGCEKVFYKVGFTAEMDQRVLAALEAHKKSMGRSGRSLLAIEDPSAPVGEMRLFKGPEELQLLRKACQISAKAHKTAMKETRPGMNEAEIEAWVDFVFRKEGCERVGYPSIVASGKNATCLHYRSNNENVKEGDLLLIDAGGEYGYYSADITRTFPVGKTFSAAQAEIYDLVLKAQKAAIAMSKPGALLPAIHKTSCEVITDGLLSLGILKGNAKDILKNGEYKRFFPHQTSHWLGMDVHDAGLYVKNGEPRVLEPGMVFTIEPGFYVQPSDREAPSKYAHIGIRIEDDILITRDGSENLTIDAPKERSEIEALRS